MHLDMMFIIIHIGFLDLLAGSIVGEYNHLLAMINVCVHTVDGRNPAPPGMYKTL